MEDSDLRGWWTEFSVKFLLRFVFLYPSSIPLELTFRSSSSLSLPLLSNPGHLDLAVEANVIGETARDLGRDGVSTRLHLDRIQCLTCLMDQDWSRWVVSHWSLGTEMDKIGGNKINNGLDNQE